jgi:hypothetical protein
VRLPGRPSSQREALIWVVVAFFITTFLNITFVIYKVHMEDRSWCELFHTLSTPVPTPSVTPAPLTQREKKVADAFARLERGKCG